MKKTLALLDCDGTILKESLVLLHCGFLEKNGVINTRGAYGAWESDMKNEHLITQCAMVYQHALIGLTLEEMRVDEFIISEFIKNGTFQEEKFYSETLEIIANQDNECHVITGTPSFLAEKLFQLISPMIEVHGSVYEYGTHGFTGIITVPMFSAETKQGTVDRILAKKNYDFNRHHIIGCGDTMSDLPLFEIADERILVEPTRDTLIKYSKLGYTFNQIID